MSWQDEAFCAEVDGDLFFPEKGEHTSWAKKLCASCPVKLPCLEMAMDEQIEFGVWGGLTAYQRKQLRRASA
jgi:WhiB family redox-sensing transcriptional regulator